MHCNKKFFLTIFATINIADEKTEDFTALTAYVLAFFFTLIILKLLHAIPRILTRLRDATRNIGVLAKSAFQSAKIGS